MEKNILPAGSQLLQLLCETADGKKNKERRLGLCIDLHQLQVGIGLVAVFHQVQLIRGHLHIPGGVVQLVAVQRPGFGDDIPAFLHIGDKDKPSVIGDI